MPGTMPETSYFKCYRSGVAEELLAASNSAFLLLLQIARRAQRTDSYNQNDLGIGEAFLGDFKNIGLTEGKYRHAKKYLEAHRFATFRATNKGTIATLINFDVFDPNLEDSNGQHNTPATNQRRTNNEPTTTNKNDKNDKNDKNEKGKSFREKKEISPNVLAIQLGEVIKEEKEKMKLYKSQHTTEYAHGLTWDQGRKEKYMQMKSKYEQLMEKREKLLLEA
jgi:hypothetical protein